MNGATPVRDAATLILVRDADGDPRVVMGRRGHRAAFMPGKFVFPGGRVDPGDTGVPPARDLATLCAGRLRDVDGPAPATLAAAAIRETWEETGQLLARPGAWADPPAPWSAFAARGLVPDAGALRFVFRAVTPPGPRRRFDARFFTADARALASDPDDFSHASDELSDIAWVRVSEARQLDLPFVTRAVLDHIAARLPDLGPYEDVPHFRDGDEARAEARRAQGYTT